MIMQEIYNQATDEVVELVQEHGYDVMMAVEKVSKKYGLATSNQIEKVKKTALGSQQFNLHNHSICHKREKYNLDNSQLYDENTGETEDTELEDIYKFIFEEE